MEHREPVVRVLVVDDQEPFRRAVTAVVAETGRFAVVGHAGTGEAAVAAVDALHPDLVLMDVNLPGIDGAEATRQVRQRPDPPVVLLLSTHDEEVGQRHVVESGAAAYLSKAAFGPELLLRAWEQAGGRRQRR